MSKLDKNTMAPPDRIFLQWFGEDGPFDSEKIPLDSEVCWCADKIFENDVEYVRVKRKRKL